LQGETLPSPPGTAMVRLDQPMHGAPMILERRAAVASWSQIFYFSLSLGTYALVRRLAAG
jgi:hypothetical protein